MIAVEDTVLVLLAAGRSTRFGDLGSKLEEEFLGKPLGLHVAVALESVPFKERVAVIDHCRLDYAQYDFDVIANDAPDRGMAHSVCLGIDRARAAGAQAVMIALADMPRVTAAHVYRLFDATTDEGSVVASSDGVAPKPPAIFGRAKFDELMQLAGDTGARDLVKAPERHGAITRPQRD